MTNNRILIEKFAKMIKLQMEMDHLYQGKQKMAEKE